MSETKDPNKGFLGDDLALDIEDWDRGFDSLISDPSPDTADIATIDVADVGNDLATIDLSDATAIRDVRNLRATEHDEDFADFAVSGPATIRPATIALGEDDVEDSIATVDVDAPMRDSDFSMVGVEGAPTALGSLLAAGARAPTGLDDVTNPRLRPTKNDTYSDTVDAEDVAEDDVFTSASRPFPAITVAPTNNEDIDDPVVAPPQPVRALPLAAPVEPEARRTPAIVRRTAAVATPPTEDKIESTRIVDLQAYAPPVVEVVVDEDAYDDIEIDASPTASSTTAPVATPAEPAVKRTAHIVRRNEGSTTAAPPMRYGSAPVIEVDTGDGAKQLAAADRIPTVAPTDYRRSKPITGRIGGKQTTPPPMVDEFADFADPAHESVPVAELAHAAEDSMEIPMGRASSDSLDLSIERHGSANEAEFEFNAAPVAEVAPDHDTMYGDGADDVAGETLLGIVAAPLDDDLEGPAERAPTHALIDDEPNEVEVEAENVRTPTIVAHGAPPMPTEYVPVRPAIAELTSERVEAPIATWQIDPADFAESATPAPQREETLTDWLSLLEREIAIVDDVTAASLLRTEAGRVSERIEHVERARQHYEAALLDDPTARPVLRGLRSLAMRARDMVETQRLLELEQALAAPAEQNLLARHRVDLLMAAGELDLARVAVGEILDVNSADVPSLFAQLELTLCDGRVDEFATAMAQLDSALSDPTLRASVALARAGVSSANAADHAAVVTGAHQADPASALAMLQLARVALTRGERDAAAVYYAGMAELVAQQVGDGAQAVSAAARLRSIQLGDRGIDSWTIASPTANALLANLPSVNTSARERAATALSSQSFAVSDAPMASLRRAAVLANAERGALTWDALFDDVELAAYARQQAGQAAGGHSGDPWTDAAEHVRLGQLAQARQALADLPVTPAYVALIGPQLAAAGQADAHRALLRDVATGSVGNEYYNLRAGLTALFAGSLDTDGSVRAGWQALFDDSQPALALAALHALPTKDAAQAEQVWAALSPEERLARSVGLARRHLAAGDVAAANAELERSNDDRGDARWVALRTLTILANPTADRNVRARDTAATYEDAANAAIGDDADSIAALRLRTAQLFIDAGAAAEAATMFEQVENHWPASSLISDLHALASRRAGQDVAKTESETTFKPVAPEVLANPAAREHAYARMMRQADVYISYGDHSMAQQALASALELRPGDPGATAMSELLAHRHGDSALAVVRATGRVQFADQLGDPAAIADAQVQLADLELWDRHNVEAARTALQIAYECAPQRWSTLDRMVMLAALRNDPDALALARQRQADLAVTEAEFASHHYQDAAATLEAIGADSRRVLDLSRKALQVSPPLRGAMLFAERAAQALGDVQELAHNDDRIAAYFTGDARSQAAFLTRAGVYWVDAGQHETAIARFRAAEGVMPAYIPALEGWRRASLRGQLWLDVANAALREAIATHDAPRRTKLFHLAGVVLMEKALVPERAIEAFRYVLDSDPSHRDAFLRTRILLSEEGNHDELALVLEKRLEVETDPALNRELHRAVAELHRNFLSNREGAMTHYREILRTAPNDVGAQTALADIAWELGDWHGAAQALIARARLERSPEVARSLAKRLGMLYADRLGEPVTALAWYERALAQMPDDEDALVRVAELAGKAGDWNRAMAAAERLVKSENDADARVAHWHRVADIFENGFGDAKRAERAYNQALDGAPSNAAALDGLIKFYKRRSDTVSIRVHLGRVASAVRARIDAEPTDIEAYRVLARTMEARHEAGVDGSIAIARSAHDMVAILTGQEPAVNPKAPMIPTPSSLLTVEADEVIFPPEVQPELRQLFQLLGERLSKHVGVDLRHHGVTRSDKIGNDQAVARAAIVVGGALGFADIEVYVSTRQPMVFAAEPTHPVSVVIGSALAGGDRDNIRFATGAALKLAQSQLAVAARLPVNELGVLVIALVRLFQPDFPAISVDLDAVAAQMQRLRRLIPSNAMNDLRPFALAIDASRFNHVALAAGLATASYRAGVASAQSLSAGLKVLAIRAGMPVTQYIREPVARALIQWALSEDHGIVAR